MATPSLTSSSDAAIQAATAVSLTFTTQKNGVKGEVISHGRSGHPLVCPVLAIARRVLYLRSIAPDPNIPLCQYRDNNGATRYVRSQHLTTMLRFAVTIMTDAGLPLNIQPDEVSARSLRAGGATALLIAEIDTDKIQLIGHWKSDAMIRYLHIAADPAVHQYAQKMCGGGYYSFRPGFTVPTQDL